MTLVTVMVVAPGAKPLKLSIPNDLDSMQALVGGYIEANSIADGLKAFLNEEGLLHGLPPNLRTETGVLLCGTIFFSRNDDEGEAIDLTADDEKDIHAFLATCDTFVAQYDMPMFAGPGSAPRYLTTSLAKVQRDTP